MNSNQIHNHEFLGNSKIDDQLNIHNHRFVGMTTNIIKTTNGSHYHKFSTDTDYFKDHFHMLFGKTSEAIDIGEGRHIHFVSGRTTLSNGHVHEVIFTTLIDNPIES